MSIAISIKRRFCGLRSELDQFCKLVCGSTRICGSSGWQGCSSCDSFDRARSTLRGRQCLRKEDCHERKCHISSETHGDRQNGVDRCLRWCEGDLLESVVKKRGGRGGHG